MDVKGYQERYAKLNDRQKQAVEAIDGPVMVIAGPGTGKTELLSMRVANILQKTDALPENILCLTYTDSGAAAMRKRLIDIIGADAYKVAIHTFHSFGSEVINQNPEFFFNGAQFQAADELVTYEVLNHIFEQLPLNHPFASKMNGEFTMRKDVAGSIEELKKAGLTPDALREILTRNQPVIERAETLLSEAFDGRMNPGMLPKIESAFAKIQAIEYEPGQYDIPAWKPILVSSLASALEAAHEHPRTTPPLTAWKTKWMKANDQKQLMLRASEQQQKLRLVADIYELYLAAMQKRERYDFNDMILQVVNKLQAAPELLYNLQEKYQYFLVDEFQDTNLAQLRIVHLLTDSPVNEGKPNVFVVGDPDQAIYSFQGADVSNLLTFVETYPATQQIILTDNYRSTQGILDSSREIITKSSERLADRTPELDQPLKAAASEQSAPQIYELPSTSAEYDWVASQIAEKIEQGVKPADIAVLMFGHAELQAFLPHLATRGVAVTYERQDDVLTLPPIVALTELARLIELLAEQRLNEANAYLPEILSHPAWGFAPADIWKLSSLAHTQHRLWLDAMEALPEFELWRNWLLQLVAQSHHTPLEEMIDQLLGVPDQTAVQPAETLYSYYFSPEALESNPAAYVECIEGLTSLRQKLLEQSASEPLRLADFISFVDLHMHAQVKIPITRQVGTEASVHVMTTHKSKGLEFEHVYVVGVTDDRWHGDGRHSNISYPENLAILRNDTSADERLRLFYVALTRAKRSLTITYSVKNHAQKTLLPASFLSEWQATPVELQEDAQATVNRAMTSWHVRITEPVQELRAFLAPRLEEYRLSASDFTKFLDLMYGGPRDFITRSLLRFPSASTPSSKYGNAVHDTLCYLHTEFLIDKTTPTVEKALKQFDKELRSQSLSDEDFARYHEKGVEELTAYIEAHANDFSTSQKPELSLSYEDSRLGDVRMGGRLDLVDINNQEKTIEVIDYKTGAVDVAWSNSSSRLHKYRQQLMFYKLLLENSRSYHNFTVSSGAIDFLRPTRSGEVVRLPLYFEASEMQRFEKLVTAVWQHIQELNIPDTTHYPATVKGTLAFEEDLIEGVI